MDNEKFTVKEEMDLLWVDYTSRVPANLLPLVIEINHPHIYNTWYEHTAVLRGMYTFVACTFEFFDLILQSLCA